MQVVCTCHIYIQCFKLCQLEQQHLREEFSYTVQQIVSRKLGKLDYHHGRSYEQLCSKTEEVIARKLVLAWDETYAHVITNILI